MISIHRLWRMGSGLPNLLFLRHSIWANLVWLGRISGNCGNLRVCILFVAKRVRIFPRSTHFLVDGKFFCVPICPELPPSGSSLASPKTRFHWKCSRDGPRYFSRTLYPRTEPGCNVASQPGFHQHDRASQRGTRRNRAPNSAGSTSLVREGRGLAANRSATRPAASARTGGRR